MLESKHCCCGCVKQIRGVQKREWTEKLHDDLTKPQWHRYRFPNLHASGIGCRELLASGCDKPIRILHGEMYYKETYLLFIVVLKRTYQLTLCQKFPNLTTRAVHSNEYDTTVGQTIYPWDKYSKLIAESGVLRNLEDLQSWTKVLTHLSKTNVFYRRLSVISKSIFFVDSQPPLSPFSMLQYPPWTLSPGYNIEKGRGGRNVKIRHWKLTTGLFRRVSQLLLSMIVESFTMCKI